jgi:ABC-2 type transport system permease protein
MLLLAGIYYPVSLLPAPLRALAAGIPLTYFLDGFRTGYGFTPLFRAPFVQGFVVSLVYLGLAYWGLTLAVERARRTGTILRLSE